MDQRISFMRHLCSSMSRSVSDVKMDWVGTVAGMPAFAKAFIWSAGVIGAALFSAAVLAQSVSGTNYGDTSLSSGTPYSYTVKASGENVESAQVSATRALATGTYTASGTYTWNSTTGVITITWTSSNFVCDGPELGTDEALVTTLTATTMIWVYPDSWTDTWSRSSGTAGDIVGTWTISDSTTGNSYTVIFNADGTVSVTGVIVQCSTGGGGSQNPSANSQHWSNGYYVQLQYRDSPKTATAVSVTGPGITGSKSLTYSTSYGSWNSWTLPSTQVSFGTSYPTGLPYTYTFTITDTSTWTATSTVSCFQQQFVTNTSPSGTVTGTPTFSWTGIGDSSARYQVELNDSNYNRIWDSFNISGTSVIYNGPTLTSGATYRYDVIVSSSSACSSGASFAQGTFTYGSGGGDTSPPTVPTGVNAVAVGSNQVNVSWNISTDNVGVTYYQVYRNGVLAGTPAGPTNNFWLDNSVVPSTTYSYTVAACDAAGNCSAQSSAASATTQAGPQAPQTVEFYNTNLDHYFITADPIEAAAVDNGAAGPGWSRTGDTFNAGGNSPVCRFYGSMSPGPNSHFYTVLADECESLKQLQAVTPATQKRWNFESLDFVSTAPANRVCPTGTVPVYRAYNNGWARGVDSNHRITSKQASIQQVVARGWIDEGVVMCAPAP